MSGGGIETGRTPRRPEGWDAEQGDSRIGWSRTRPYGGGVGYSRPYRERPDASGAARVAAATAVLDRGHGKPRQALEHGGDRGGAIQIVYPGEETKSRRTCSANQIAPAYSPRRKCEPRAPAGHDETAARPWQSRGPAGSLRRQRVRPKRARPADAEVIFWRIARHETERGCPCSLNVCSIRVARKRPAH
jgi:hypothetical protein